MKSMLLHLSCWAALVGSMAGCASNKPATNVERAYSTAFKTLPDPGAESIRSRGISRELKALTREQVWDATLVVGVQLGPVVRADPAGGTLVIPPFAILLEPLPQLDPGVGSTDLGVILHVSFIDELYFDAENPNQEVFHVSPEEKRQFVQELLDRVVTQASIGQSLSRSGKWNYLAE
jgi:hypothetical protein